MNASYQRGQGHTPGPWFKHPTDRAIHPATSDWRHEPAIAVCVSAGIRDAQAVANAHLIAAAPELAAHGEELLIAFAEGVAWTDEQRGAYEKFAATLSKALSLADAGKGVGRG